MIDKYSKYKNIGFSSEQWYVIKNAIDEDIDVIQIANPKLTADQMRILIDARKNGIGLDGLADPDLKEEQLERIINKIANEMGAYDAHYETVRRKWIQNTTFIIILISVVTLTLGIVYATKDDWMKYFEPLYLKFNTKVVELSVGESFKPTNYIKAYDPEARVSYPNLESINTTKPGNYWAIYKISNGKKEKNLKLLIRVRDTTGPQLELTNSEISINENDEIDPYKYVKKAYDDVDGELTNKVVADIKEDMIVYTISDSSKNKTEKIIKIKYKNPDIVPTPQTTPPPVTQPPKPAPITSGKLPVIAQTRDFMFEEGKTFDDTRQICLAAATEAINSKTANIASCNPIYNDEGLPIGFRLTFK